MKMNRVAQVCVVLAMVAGLSLSAMAGEAVPANDLCGGAQAIVRGDTAFVTTGAATDGPAHPGSDCDQFGDANVNQDIWYEFTADCTGPLTVSTCDAADFDTRIAVYSGCACPVDEADLLACNDDGEECENFTSRLTIDVVEGECYKIRVGAYGEVTGTGTLNLFCEMSFDPCIGATGSCVDGHGGIGCNDPVCCGAVCSQDDYCCTFEWDAGCAELAMASCSPGACCEADGACRQSLEDECAGEWHAGQLCEDVDCPNPSCFDSTGDCHGLGPNDTPGCEDLSCCSRVCGENGDCCEVEWDASCVALAWHVCALPAGYGACCEGESCSGVMLEAECEGIWFAGVHCEDVDCAAAVGDLCPGALAIHVGETEFSTAEATTDGPPHSSCEFDGQTYNDIWYNFTATSTGELTVSTCNTAQYDTDLAVYEGCGCPVNDARLLDCNDDQPGCSGYTSRVTVNVEQDVCYKIRVGGYNAQSRGTGTVVLELEGGHEACTDGVGDCYGLGEDDSPGCEDAACCALVCAQNTDCCDVAWAEDCDDLAWTVCEGPTGIGACCVDEVCTPNLAEQDCAGVWYEGDRCSDVSCAIATADFCDIALPILDGDTAFDTLLAATDGPAHPGCYEDGQTYNDIWFDYIATGSGDLTVTTCNMADYDTDLVVYAGCDCPVDQARMLACNDDTPGCDNFTSMVTVPVSEGACYKLRVGGWHAESRGTGTVNLSIDEANEACLDADGSCYEAHDGVGCNQPLCCDAVCAEDEFCCSLEWDAACVALAIEHCGALGACCVAGECVGTMLEEACTGSWYEGDDCAVFACPAIEYCDPCWEETDPNPDDIITNVTFHTINNTTEEEGMPCQHADYRGVSTDVVPGQTYTLSVTVDPCHDQGCWPQQVRAWVDWDQDGQLEGSEAYDLGLAEEGAETVTIDVTVPDDATEGATLLRVSEAYEHLPEPCEEGQYGSTEDYTVVVVGAGPATLVEAVPSHEASLWRHSHNRIELVFDRQVGMPDGGLLIQAMLDGGSFGPNLAESFAFTTDGSTLVIAEQGGVLTHGTWIAVRNTGDYAGVAPFALHYVVVMGDANADGQTLPNDLSLINTLVPTFHMPFDPRLDIDGSGSVLPNDLSLCNAFVPTFAIPKPAGHE